ncbi:hypothetical protein A1Q1_07888 [Trichosporon asahii var. asahii CBS 2479]|uniref:Uncharacterized protein n=1 Tax=Trichosporon asahii var. asahii (strain ATCC 90039 / CBS 2479 / JCM 2466 / KCTC 7840 / NBRC 103889/ NCYC 2677 / UAMH 7654) TaxID=1186058 RepID=J4UH89_TRIAS|nr:hypothetical protein A1Q1_07888 [Trichosporon asahii var. asahii CBS 2479]EJT50915.1 hypothetical protein A1Q1_07888 [Trichosporon asahii var. asahii CBS 2479]
MADIRAMSVIKRCLSTAGTAGAASSAAAAVAATSSVPTPRPPPSSSSRPSALLEAYVNQPPPPAPKPDEAWKCDLFSTMAFSPQRECAVTKAHLPNAFMVSFRAGEGDEANIVFPDRLEHPKFKRRRQGRSFWTALHRDAVENLQTKGKLATADQADVKAITCGICAESGAMSEAILLAEALAGDAGQRHILSLSEVQRKGPLIQGTEDGKVVAIVDLRSSFEEPTALGPDKDRKPTPLRTEDLSSLAPRGMLKRRSGVPGIPLFRLREAAYGEPCERVEELERLLRSVKDEDVLVLQAPRSGDPLAIPLAVALWRRLLFTGQGWKRSTKPR